MRMRKEFDDDAVDQQQIGDEGNLHHLPAESIDCVAPARLSDDPTEGDSGGPGGSGRLRDDLRVGDEDPSTGASSSQGEDLTWDAADANQAEPILAGRPAPVTPPTIPGVLILGARDPKQRKCLRCGHQWFIRPTLAIQREMRRRQVGWANIRPRACPSCKSPQWDKRHVRGRYNTREQILDRARKVAAETAREIEGRNGRNGKSKKGENGKKGEQQ